ncbi:MAG: pyridoxal phosphate-dependent aminotransferase [Alphaproteobacteria bacterium]
MPDALHPMSPIPTALSGRAGALRASQIREVAEEGMRMEGVIPLWFGESAWGSPDLAVETAVAALRAGDHFYQPNSGRPALRQAIAGYMREIYGIETGLDRITVTASGMQGLALTAQAIVDPGDDVVVVDPAWPNIPGCFQIAGAAIRTVGLAARDGRWQLDLDRLLDALTPSTRALVVNSPNNPTGWVMDRASQQAVLARCRRHGTWIVADDVYSRLYLAGDHAPSFLEIAEPEDRLVSVNSFSKAWSMTGWRLGWTVAPALLEPILAMLTEFNIAGPSGFVQQAGIAALRDGEPFVAEQRTRLAAAYAVVARRLAAIPGVAFVAPEGAFYAFFRIDGLADSLGFAKRLLREAKVGLAPGIAFGPAGEGHLRLCYARDPALLEEALDRLDGFMRQESMST